MLSSKNATARWKHGMDDARWTFFFYNFCMLCNLALTVVAILELTMFHAFEETTYMWTILLAAAIAMEILLFCVIYRAQQMHLETASKGGNMNDALSYSSYRTLMVKPMLFFAWYSVVGVLCERDRQSERT